MDTIQLIAAFVRSVGLQRALFEADSNSHLNFWRVMQGNCMDMAAIDWCKLFGSDNKASQPAHWKNVVPASKHDAFLAGLLAVMGLTKREWKRYRNSIVDYRNTMAAHLDEPSKRPSAYPTYDKALLAAGFYYDHIMRDASVKEAHREYPEDLIQYEREFQQQAFEIAKLASAATASFPERVH